MAQKIPCYNLIRKGGQRENNIKSQGKVGMLSVSEDAQISVPGADLGVKFVHLRLLKTLETQVKARGSCIQSLFLCKAPGPGLPLFLRTPNYCCRKSVAWNGAQRGT